MPGRLNDREPRVSTEAAAISCKQPSGPRTDEIHESQLQRRFHDCAAKSQGAREIGKSSQKHSPTRRQWKRAEVQSRDDGQSSERADQEFVQIVAGDIFHDASAALRDDALASNKLHAEQEILRRAMSIS